MKNRPSDIAARVEAWVFSYNGEESREEQCLVKEAAAFLQSNKHLFPPGSLPARRRDAEIARATLAESDAPGERG